MTKLSVNVNEIALLRNSREGDFPNVLEFSHQALELGVDGITVHPRPDGRHIRYEDVAELKLLVECYPEKEFNIEGYPSTDFLELVCDIQPDQVTFVPDPPDALTSSFGWDVTQDFDLISNAIAQVHEKNIRSSLFIDTACNAWDQLKATKTDRVELYTGPFAEDYLHYPDNLENAVQPYTALAKTICDLGIQLNAGHDLNLDNLTFFLKHVPKVQEVSIGHALVCDALHYGWKETIKRYLESVNF